MTVSSLWHCRPELVMDLSAMRQEKTSTVEGRNEITHEVCSVKPLLLITPRGTGNSEQLRFIKKLESIQESSGRKFYSESDVRTGPADGTEWSQGLRTHVREITNSIREWREGRKWRKNRLDRRELNRAVLVGFVASLVNEGSLLPGGVGVSGVSGPQEQPPREELCAVSHVDHFDNISGEWLRPDLVKTARSEEMEEVRKHQVYEKVDLEQCYNSTGRGPIGTRWVDTNKGDSVHLEYRSRLVAQEINTYKREDLFAATSPTGS